MHVSYNTQGTCSKVIDFDLEDGKVTNISFLGGCNGNLKAISKLCEGKDAREVAKVLLGNDCNGRGTSCGDQFAKAIIGALDK